MPEEVSSATGTSAPAPPSAPASDARQPISLGNLRDIVSQRLTPPATEPPPATAVELPVPAAPAPTPGPPSPEQQTVAEAKAPEQEFDPEQLGDIPKEIVDPAAAADVAKLSEVEAVQDDPAIQQLLKDHPPLKHAWRHHSIAKSYEKPWEEGGIGHVPTTEEMRSYFNSHVAMSEMMEHFRSEDIGHRAEWIARFFGTGGPDTPAANEILALQPKVLAKVNPDGFHLQANTYGEYHFERLYAMADKMADQAQRNRVLDAARMLEWAITGQYRPIGAEAQRQPTPEEMDIARRRQELERDRQQLQQQRKSEAEAQMQRNLERVTSSQNSLMDTDVRKALERALDGLNQDYQEFLVEKLKRQLRADVDRDQHRKKLVLGRGRDIARSGAMDQMEEYLRQYRQLYIPSLQKHASQFIREAAGEKSAAIQRQIPTPERATQLQQSANNLNPGGAPARPVDPRIGNAPSPKDRQPGESLDAFAERAVRARLSFAG